MLHVPTHAVFSGFTLSPEDLKAFMLPLQPSYKDRPELPLNLYVMVYDGLRREQRDRAPNLPKLRNIEKEIVREVIFLVRGVVFEDDSQLDPTCDKHKALWTPNDTDKAHLEDFKSFVASVGAELPADARVGFACIKDIHPAFDDRDEELDALIKMYENRGHFEEVVGLLEAGLSLKRAHVGFCC
ncbi:hypothetical protein DXG03_005873 [Asterophora parasitica]|uniref:Uncharacterized protein n=1 Tax=Asterophora parasitica TaxID=117018 RepID=A0A9P7G610_9AGAR|nr:hypothetical protein DXG03_005873 [Asterophora parasitica]